jgi:hypothetical protein
MITMSFFLTGLRHAASFTATVKSPLRIFVTVIAVSYHSEPSDLQLRAGKWCGRPILVRPHVKQ